MPDFITDHEALFAWLGIASIAIFILSLLFLPWLASIIPEDYFVHSRRQASPWKASHPAIRLFLLLGKNLLGIALLVGGIVMLITPGQGLMTIVAGLVLIDYPGKFYLERRIVSQPSIYKGINWLRHRRGKPPITIDQ